MKYLLYTMLCLISGCVSLTGSEKAELRRLEAQGITVAASQSEWEPVANPAAAGALNLLPGFGNFYLAAGNGGVSDQYLVGALNLISWPFSVLWGVPQGVIDARTINQRELLWYQRAVKGNRN